jgi:division protein CdvB (Snf7/Vps24/ESCRT-III family)
MDTEQQFDELKRKYAPVLQVLERNEARIQAMNIQDGKLMIRAAVSSPDARDHVLAEIERIDGSFAEVIPDIRVEGQPNMPATGQNTVQTSQNFSQQGERPPQANERQPR